MLGVILLSKIYKIIIMQILTYIRIWILHEFHIIGCVLKNQYLGFCASRVPSKCSQVHFNSPIKSTEQ
ncbi:unnamed protein product [Cuscuta campestris]|uniref:Uncharacterized protein n=1 Tax=Cuscuta campestris TaxID=132261 RepID=A0A484N171_9ASTE|nr:unnamed protein product [Cuscuta campestris]